MSSKMPEPQLLVRTVRVLEASAPGVVIPIKFNLQRGKIARVLGFSIMYALDLAPAFVIQSIFRKAINAKFSFWPTDILWGHTWMNGDAHYNLPKPYRTTGISVNVQSTPSTTADILYTILYDVDDMAKDEEIATLETTRQKGRRVT